MSKKKAKREHKRSYNMINNPDSIWSRSSSKRAKSSADTMRMLDIEEEDPTSIIDKHPLKMMDIVLQSWGVDTGDDEEEETDD